MRPPETAADMPETTARNVSSSDFILHACTHTIFLQRGNHFRARVQTCRHRPEPTYLNCRRPCGCLNADVTVMFASPEAPNFPVPPPHRSQILVACMYDAHRPLHLEGKDWRCC